MRCMIAILARNSGQIRTAKGWAPNNARAVGIHARNTYTHAVEYVIANRYFAFIDVRQLL